MNSDFNFVGFGPTENLREKANVVLDRLLESAPSGAVAAALIEKDEYSFCCAIEIYSRKGPLTARGYNSSPDVALENVARSLSNKLKHWKEARNFPERDAPKELAQSTA